MTTKAQCLDALLGFIDRADRDEIAGAQAAIIAFALDAPDIAARRQAMAELQADLARLAAEHGPEPIQAAYYAVVDAMIDRTRDAVLSPKAARG